MRIMQQRAPAQPQPLAASPARAQPQPDAVPWWCSPAGLALGFLLPMFGLVSFAVEFNLDGLTARGLRFLTPGYLWLGAALLLALAYGGWLGARLDTGAARPAPTHDIDRAVGLIGCVAVLAYAVWFRGYLADPAWLWAILSGSAQPARADELVPGLTSLANGGPVFFAAYAWRLVWRRDRPMPRGLHLLFATLAVLTAFRVYAWSERLALIEAVLPLALMGALAAARSQRAKSPALRWLLVLGPFLALPLLMLYFGLAESVRSWSSDTYNGKLDFWSFVLGRLASYYYTALNNGAGILATQDWPTWRFEYVANMLHTAPLAVGTVFSALVGSRGPDLDAFLQRYADVEFNNPSGLYTVPYDLGVPLGLLYFAVVGFVSGLLFKRWRAGSFSAALLYPVFFISGLEVFRYPYLGSGRAFAWTVCALLVLAIVWPARHRRGHVAARADALANAGRSRPLQMHVRKHARVLTQHST